VHVPSPPFPCSQLVFRPLCFTTSLPSMSLTTYCHGYLRPRAFLEQPGAGWFPGSTMTAVTSGLGQAPTSATSMHHDLDLNPSMSLAASSAGMGYPSFQDAGLGGMSMASTSMGMGDHPLSLASSMAMSFSDHGASSFGRMPVTSSGQPMSFDHFNHAM